MSHRNGTRASKTPCSSIRITNYTRFAMELNSSLPHSMEEHAESGISELANDCRLACSSPLTLSGANSHHSFHARRIHDSRNFGYTPCARTQLSHFSSKLQLAHSACHRAPPMLGLGCGWYRDGRRSQTTTSSTARDFWARVN